MKNQFVWLSKYYLAPNTYHCFKWLFVVELNKKRPYPYYPCRLLLSGSFCTRIYYTYKSIIISFNSKPLVFTNNTFFSFIYFKPINLYKKKIGAKIGDSSFLCFSLVIENNNKISFMMMIFYEKRKIQSRTNLEMITKTKKSSKNLR